MPSLAFASASPRLSLAYGDVLFTECRCPLTALLQVLDMYHGNKAGAVGMTTTGGTESIMMAVRAHKEWAKEAKGITTPHVVLPR